MVRKLGTLVAIATMIGVAEAREMTSAYIVPVAGNKVGVNNTDWHTDLTIYNPQDVELPMVMQFLETGSNNAGGAPTIDGFSVRAWETLNLWDVLGPKGFARRGRTGALLVYIDDLVRTCKEHECDFAVFSRTYTLDPARTSGEFGQAIPGFPLNLGLDRTVLAFMPQLLHDDDFRTNAGVASFSNATVTVRFELQDQDGNIIHTGDASVLPYSHLQWRLERRVTGGTLAAFIISGPADALVYPYGSVVNNATGDPVYIEAHLTPVGVASGGKTAERAAPARAIGSRFPARTRVVGFEPERLMVRPPAAQ
jgi:hypothetical protein